MRNSLLDGSQPDNGRIGWVKDGYEKSLSIQELDSHFYLGLDELARVSSGQIRWQDVTQQACLLRQESILCFNWDRDIIYHDGLPIQQKARLHLNKNMLYVPLAFVEGKEFQKFSDTRINWVKAKRQLIQNTPVNLSIPPVENLGDRYRIQLSLEEKTPYRLLDKSQGRIWVRFIQGRTSGSTILEGDDVIKEVRILQRRKTADLIVKPGKAGLSNDIFYDPDNKMLVIDVFTKEGMAERGKYVDRRVPVPVFSGKKTSTRNGRTSAVKNGTLKTIVIDAGHGGKDSGALGARGTQEKDINLKFAETLADRLKKEKDIRVILTREKDEFMPLGERIRMANQVQADLFISLHCNSSLSSKSSGFEVYLLSSDASDEAAAAVARKENSVISLETNGGSSSNKLTELLASMAINGFINESSECAAYLCRGVKNKSTVESTAVKEANFHVLRGAEMPAVLVEMEYISNPISELKLRSSRYRNLLVKGLADGILQFIEEQRKKADLVYQTNQSLAGVEQR